MSKHHRIGGPRAQGFAKLPEDVRKTAASIGGLALVRRYGAGHMREIGRRGGESRKFTSAPSRKTNPPSP